MSTLSPSAWARNIVAGLGGNPSNARAIRLAEAWEAAEGSTPAWRNPLDTTLQMPGSIPENNNVPPVQGYRTNRQGLAATLSTLKESRYSTIRQALRTGNIAKFFSDQGVSEINTWGTNPAGIASRYQALGGGSTAVSYSQARFGFNPGLIPPGYSSSATSSSISANTLFTPAVKGSAWENFLVQLHAIETANPSFWNIGEDAQVVGVKLGLITLGLLMVLLGLYLALKEA